MCFRCIGVVARSTIHGGIYTHVPLKGRSRACPHGIFGAAAASAPRCSKQGVPAKLSLAYWWCVAATLSGQTACLDILSRVQPLHSISYLANLRRPGSRTLRPQKDESGHHAKTTSCGDTRAQTPPWSAGQYASSAICLQVHEVTLAFLDTCHFPLFHAIRTSTRVSARADRLLLPAMRVPRPKRGMSRLFLVSSSSAGMNGVLSGMCSVICPVSNDMSWNVSGMAVNIASILNEHCRTRRPYYAAQMAFQLCPSRQPTATSGEGFVGIASMESTCE